MGDYIAGSAQEECCTVAFIHIRKRLTQTGGIVTGQDAMIQNTTVHRAMGTPVDEYHGCLCGIFKLKAQNIHSVVCVIRGRPCCGIVTLQVEDGLGLMIVFLQLRYQLIVAGRRSIGINTGYFSRPPQKVTCKRSFIVADGIHVIAVAAVIIQSSCRFRSIYRTLGHGCRRPIIDRFLGSGNDPVNHPVIVVFAVCL